LLIGRNRKGEILESSRAGWSFSRPPCRPTEATEETVIVQPVHELKEEAAGSGQPEQPEAMDGEMVGQLPQLQMEE